MPATGSVALVPFWNVSSTGEPTSSFEVLGRVLLDEDAAVGHRLVAARLEVDVDELLEGQRVDGAERLLLAVDERRRAAHAR